MGGISSPSPFPLILAVTVVLLMGSVLGVFGVYAGLTLIGAMILVIILLLQQREAAAALLIAVSLYIDWYLGLHLVAVALAFILLLVFWLTRSVQHPWVEPRAIWLWALFLVLGIYPAVQGALMLYDAATYYPSDILGAFLTFWLGSVLARDSNCVRRLFSLFAGLGTLIAVHTLIQSATGTTLFASSHYDALFLANSAYELARTNAHRAGSFFVDPNWNGTFLATMFFLPLGLFVESPSVLKKILYLTEALTLLPALLFTYSSGAIVSVIGSLLVFIGYVGQTRYRILLLLLSIGIASASVALFPSQTSFLFLHASEPDELSLRVGAWKTALQVIGAFPLTGVGLGYEAYQLRADPYRLPEQFVPLSHPHNSYLEWGAKAGLPVLAVFLALLIYALWHAHRNWSLSKTGTRPLLGGGLAAIIALSINSWSINGWTLPVLSLLGWLLLGILSSPLLMRSLYKEAGYEENQATLE